MNTRAQAAGSWRTCCRPPRVRRQGALGPALCPHRPASEGTLCIWTLVVFFHFPYRKHRFHSNIVTKSFKNPAFFTFNQSVISKCLFKMTFSVNYSTPKSKAVINNKTRQVTLECNIIPNYHILHCAVLFSIVLKNLHYEILRVTLATDKLKKIKCQ